MHSTCLKIAGDAVKDTYGSLISEKGHGQDRLVDQTQFADSAVFIFLATHNFCHHVALEAVNFIPSYELTQK